MKSPVCFRPLISVALLGASCAGSNACGPYIPTIPMPEFFATSAPAKTMADYEREENLLLWQSQTDRRIPLRDIEEAVYRSSYDDFFRDNPDNMFLRFLHNTDDTEITDLLLTAKRMETLWSKTRSPWYYPADRYNGDDTGDFQGIIDLCEAYSGTRMRDRYGLQMVRALFASRRYSDCVRYYDRTFRHVPDTNLMKRMSQRYVAGCLSRMADTAGADSLFAAIGDVWSLSADGTDRVAYMARHNPGAPQLMDYIRSNADDTTFMRSAADAAKGLLNDPRVTNRGDWLFLMAYVSHKFNGDTRLADRQIRQALRQRFSTDELASLARIYGLKISAYSGNTDHLTAELRRCESKTDPLQADAGEWVRRIRNIIYEDWVPQLWKRRDNATAILLCAYADNLGQPERLRSQQRQSETQFNTVDYQCLSFQLMGSLKSSQLAAVYRQILTPTQLYAYLCRYARTDSDYFNELIGTLAIREENFTQAIACLSKVSPGYQRTTNLFKCGYLDCEPFRPCPMSFDAGEKPSQLNAKLNFAKRMLALQRAAKHGQTADERGMSRLMYAIGRYNSLEECWPLTQYWRGECTGIFKPALRYDWDDDFANRNYGFLYDYEAGNDTTEAICKREIEAAMAMFESPGARAEAEYMFGNVKTVIRKYPDTPTARLIRQTCDNWKAWL